MITEPKNTMKATPRMGNGWTGGRFAEAGYRRPGLPYILIGIVTMAIVWFAHQAGASVELTPWSSIGGSTLTGLAAPPAILIGILFFLHGDVRRGATRRRFRTEP